jgi:hypothetical protein
MEPPAGTDQLARQCPYRGRPHGRRVYLQDASDNSAIRRHVAIVIVPLAGEGLPSAWPRRGFKCFALTARLDSGDSVRVDIRATSTPIKITGANFMGPVGLDWQVGGFSKFSSRGPQRHDLAQ